MLMINAINKVSPLSQLTIDSPSVNVYVMMTTQYLRKRCSHPVINVYEFVVLENAHADVTINFMSISITHAPFGSTCSD